MEDLPPTEDLMREHGVLKRVLLIYRESLRRLHHKEDLPPDALAGSAAVIRSFIEDYHEKMEEEFLFPRFESAQVLVDLVKELRVQHDRGRALTDVTRQLSTQSAIRNDADRRRLEQSLSLFIRMYEPHEAREDTVLFPALRKMVSKHELGSLGDDFEKRERQMFGQDGFEKMVDTVGRIEQELGIYELSKFTPPEKI